MGALRCTRSSGTDGSTPNAVVVANDGDLYGTTSAGGLAGEGVIFKLNNADTDGPATAFNITPNYSDPHGVENGSPVSFKLTAVDTDGRIAVGYTGTAHFTSDDPQAILPADATLTNGIGTFEATFSVTNTLTVTDTVTPAITGSYQIDVLLRANVASHHTDYRRSGWPVQRHGYGARCLRRCCYGLWRYGSNHHFRQISNITSQCETDQRRGDVQRDAEDRPG